MFIGGTVTGYDNGINVGTNGKVNGSYSGI